jgi:hypothetical protein
LATYHDYIYSPRNTSRLKTFRKRR